MKTLDWILAISVDEKELLFNYLDVSKIEMIDYQTFLIFMNGTNHKGMKNENFDWVEECF